MRPFGDPIAGPLPRPLAGFAALPKEPPSPASDRLWPRTIQAASSSGPTYSRRSPSRAIDPRSVPFSRIQLDVLLAGTTARRAEKEPSLQYLHSRSRSHSPDTPSSIHILLVRQIMNQCVGYCIRAVTLGSKRHQSVRSSGLQVRNIVSVLDE